MQELDFHSSNVERTLQKHNIIKYFNGTSFGTTKKLTQNRGILQTKKP
jgi:hypothetical protein